MKTIFLCIAGLFLINQAMAQCTSTPGTISGGSSSICSGEYTGTLTVSGGSGNFIWQINENGMGWFDRGSANEIASGIISQAGVEGNIQFRVAYCTNTTPIYTAVTTIEVHNPNGGTISGGGSTVCSGSTPGSLTVSGTKGDFLWQSSFNGSSFSNISGTANQTSYTPNISGGAGIYSYKVAADCGSNATAYSNVVSLTVNGVTAAAVCSDADNLRRAVAKVHISGIPYDFSGFLINHTSGDGRLLFLTTSHPFTRYSPNSTALNGATFTWNEDLSTCGGSAATPVTSVGCTLLVTDGFFTLLQLNAAPNLSELYYLGWDYNATGNYSSIFQSATSVKKGKVSTSSGPTNVTATISNTTDALTESSGSGVFKFSTWNSGNTEKQGRGAPLLSGSVGKKARGVYIGGDEAACGNGPSYFAYLNSGLTSLLSYLRDGSETNTSTVRMNYCKPSETLFGNINQSLPPYSVTGSIVSTQSINDGLTIRYYAGSFIELNDGFYSGTDFVAEINPCVITATTIAAKTDDIIEDPQQTISASMVGSIKIYPTVLASGNAITIEATEGLQDASVTLYDMQAKAVQYASIPELYAHDKYSLPIGFLPSGLYFLRVQNNAILTIQKIIIK
jgi:hypothetical protein